MTAPTPEVPACRDLSVLAPAFRRKVGALLFAMDARGLHAVVNETLRTDERQQWLYGFGRYYDDGRGVVTRAPTAELSWHGYGLAVDIRDGAHGWDDTPESFWAELAECARAQNLTPGFDWAHQDKPHIQWWCAGMRDTPSPHAADLKATGGLAAVWRELHAE